MDEVEDSPADSLEAVWRKQLDHRLIAGRFVCDFLIIVTSPLITEKCYLMLVFCL